MIKMILYFLVFSWVLIVSLITILVKIITTGVKADDCEKAIGKGIVTLCLDVDNINFHAKQHKNERE